MSQDDQEQFGWYIYEEAGFGIIDQVPLVGLRKEDFTEEQWRSICDELIEDDIDDETQP